MCIQRSVYSCKPYTEGFEYALKMRGGSMGTELFNPYTENEFESRAFEDGYRDGTVTVGFHQIEENV